MSNSEALGTVHEVNLPQGAIRYRERGSGRPIVFVHGYMANGDLWRKVVPLLARNHRCIVPDWPMGAHELPMPVDADLTPPAMAELVADFIAQLDLSDVVLVANDSGGAISQLVVTTHPERIGALALTPCDAFEQFPPGIFKALVWIARTPLLRNIAIQPMRLQAARRLTLRALIKGPYDKQLAGSWFDPSLSDADVRRDGNKFAAGLDSRHTLAAAKRLSEFDKPTLLAWPPENTFFTYELAERLADTIPNARLEPVPGALTFLPEDQPERLAELVGELAAA